MDSGFYAACAALMARSQALDLVANNLANTSTPGFRGQHNIFRSFLATASGHQGSGLNRAVNDFGISGGSQMDLTEGNLEHTGNDLDFGVQGPGFFQDPDRKRAGVYTQRKFSGFDPGTVDDIARRSGHGRSRRHSYRRRPGDCKCRWHDLGQGCRRRQDQAGGISSRHGDGECRQNLLQRAQEHWDAGEAVHHGAGFARKLRT